MANTQRPSNPALIHAVHVQVQGLMANFLGVACFACHWRVFSSAYFAHVALATRCIMTDFDLLFASFTVRTFYHPGILPYPHTLPLPVHKQHSVGWYSEDQPRHTARRRARLCTGQTGPTDRSSN